MPRCRTACSRPRRSATSSTTARTGAPNFSAHHQPFNYFARFAPGTARSRPQHLKDYTRLRRRHRARRPAAGRLLQAAGHAERAPGLHRRAVGRRAHRRARREDQGESAVGDHGDHRHLRRERRLLGPRARRRRAIAGDRARAFRRSSSRRSRSAATSITRNTTRRRSSSSSRCASASSRCPACARTPAISRRRSISQKLNRA